jgi:hypothetical protein
VVAQQKVAGAHHVGRLRGIIQLDLIAPDNFSEEGRAGLEARVGILYDLSGFERFFPAILATAEIGLRQLEKDLRSQGAWSLHLDRASENFERPGVAVLLLEAETFFKLGFRISILLSIEVIAEGGDEAFGRAADGWLGFLGRYRFWRRVDRLCVFRRRGCLDGSHLLRFLAFFGFG